MLFIQQVEDTRPLFENDALVFGLLMLILAAVFYTSNIKTGFWGKFYKYVPALLMCYLIPAVFNALGVIKPEWSFIDDGGAVVESETKVYFIASRYLLPAALILMTLSIDLPALRRLGSKALIMFVTGTVGIILGGFLAVTIVGAISPGTFEGTGSNEVWKGLTTIAGSWIGGGANQTAMLEIFGYNQAKLGSMVLVDVIVANIWMAVLIIGIGRSKKIDTWLRSDTSAIETLKERVTTFVESIKRNPTLTDYMIMLGIVFAGVGIAHGGALFMTDWLATFDIFGNKESPLAIFTNHFFWLVSIATIFGVFLSFTKAKNYEGAGASKIGTIFIYILVATIGMKMDLSEIFKNPGLMAIGLIWIFFHAGLLILVAKLIKAPYFFLAVGSQANVGGAASAPVVAAEFHPALASVGVIMAVFGYVVGTYGAILCGWLMQYASPG